jgi:hypothetical protein
MPTKLTICPVAAEVVAQREALAGRDLALLPGFAAHLQPALEHHAQPARPHRMPERLQAAVGVDRDLAREVEAALQHLLPRAAPFGEAEVLVDEQLGGREAVVHLGHRDRIARDADARLRIRILRRRMNLGKPV